MAKVQSPILFSSYFNISSSLLDEAGLIDPFTDVDTELFIDPVLLEKSSHNLIHRAGLAAFRAHFGNFIRLLTISEKENDVAWRGAERLLDLSEPPENGLGYGGSGRSGSSRPREVRLAIMKTAQEIIRLGSKDPEMISLMGFFEDDVGPDTISDFTTRVIIQQLAQLTQDFCQKNGVPIHTTDVSDLFQLPQVIHENGKASAMVLVPKDIVRELPIANNWGDVEKAIFHNNRIRDRVNQLLSGIAKPTIADRKVALRNFALESPKSFEEFLAAVKEEASCYDSSLDALGYYKFKSILADGFDLKPTRQYELSKGPEEIRDMVFETIEHFKHHVEKGNLWEELWVNGSPKKERAAQLIYYAIAEVFCIANNVDISPEANMGGGPIDFKYSKGYDARVLVEMKRSSGTVRHGYETQLEIYKDASRTEFGIFVVLDFGDADSKLDQIFKIQADRRSKGEQASEIVVIDATRKQSASKRKKALPPSNKK